MLHKTLLAICLLAAGGHANPVPRASSTPTPDSARPLFADTMGQAYVSAKDVTGISNLSPGSEWFTAALLAMTGIASIDPPWIVKDKNVVGNWGEATFVLHNPFKDEKKEIKVSVEDVDGGNNGKTPWWAAGYMQAMKQHGVFTAPGALKFQVGVDGNGNWLTPTSQLTGGGTYTPPAIYGLQIITGKKVFTYRTTDKEEIKKIASFTFKTPIIVQTNKGLVTTPSGFTGDTSDGLHEYAILDLKRDGGVMMKGFANRKDSDGDVVNLDDLANHVVMFMSTVDIKAALQG